MFKPQSLPKYSPFDTIHLWRLFSTAQDSCWTCQFWCLLVFPPYFTSYTLAKSFPLRTLLSSKETKKKVAQGKIGWIRKVGYGVHAMFGQKLLTTQYGVGRCAGKSPIMKWANTCWKSLKKKFTEAKHSLSPQHKLVHWYRWFPTILT